MIEADYPSASGLNSAKKSGTNNGAAVSAKVKRWRILLETEYRALIGIDAD